MRRTDSPNGPTLPAWSRNQSHESGTRSQREYGHMSPRRPVGYGSSGGPSRGFTVLRRLLLLALILAACGIWAWDNQGRIQLWLAGKPDPALAPLLLPKGSTQQIEFRASWLSPISRFAYRVDGIIQPRTQYHAASDDTNHILFKRSKAKAYQQSAYVMAVTISRVPRENPFPATPVADIAPVQAFSELPITDAQFQRMLSALEQGPWASAARYEEVLPTPRDTTPSDKAPLQTLSIYREITYTNATGARVLLSSTSVDLANSHWNRMTQNRHSTSDSPALTTMLNELFSPLEARYRELEPILDSKLPPKPKVTDPTSTATEAPSGTQPSPQGGAL